MEWMKYKRAWTHDDFAVSDPVKQRIPFWLRKRHGVISFEKQSECARLNADMKFKQTLAWKDSELWV